MAVNLARKQWSVDEYERMIAKGVLDEDNRLELIKGEIIQMAPIGICHAACVVALEELFHELVGRTPTVTVSVQNPVRLPDDSNLSQMLLCLEDPAICITIDAQLLKRRFYLWRYRTLLLLLIERSRCHFMQRQAYRRCGWSILTRIS